MVNRTIDSSNNDGTEGHAVRVRFVEDASENDTIDEAASEGHAMKFRGVDEADTEGHKAKVGIIEDADTEGHVVRGKP